MQTINFLISIANKTIDPKIYLDYEAGINGKVYKLIKSDDGKYYTFLNYQTMLIYAPVEYFDVDEDGNYVEIEVAQQINIHHLE